MKTLQTKKDDQCCRQPLKCHWSKSVLGFVTSHFPTVRLFKPLILPLLKKIALFLNNKYAHRWLYGPWDPHYFLCYSNQIGQVIPFQMYNFGSFSTPALGSSPPSAFGRFSFYFFRRGIVCFPYQLITQSLTITYFIFSFFDSNYKIALLFLFLKLFPFCNFFISPFLSLHYSATETSSFLTVCMFHFPWHINPLAHNFYFHTVTKTDEWPQWHHPCYLCS